MKRKPKKLKAVTHKAAKRKPKVKVIAIKAPVLTPIIIKIKPTGPKTMQRLSSTESAMLSHQQMVHRAHGRPMGA